jgi:hypothetical protein
VFECVVCVCVCEWCLCVSGVSGMWVVCV